MAAANRRANPGLDEGKRRQTPWDLVPAGFFRGSFLFFFFFLFLHTLSTSRSNKAQDSSHSQVDCIVHHGGEKGWRVTVGRGQVKTEPVISETVASAECGDAELLGKTCVLSATRIF